MRSGTTTEFHILDLLSQTAIMAKSRAFLLNPDLSQREWTMWSFVHQIDGPSGVDIVMVYFHNGAVQITSQFYKNQIWLFWDCNVTQTQQFGQTLAADKKLWLKTGLLTLFKPFVATSKSICLNSWNTNLPTAGNTLSMVSSLIFTQPIIFYNFHATYLWKFKF